MAKFHGNEMIRLYVETLTYLNSEVMKNYIVEKPYEFWKLKKLRDMKDFQSAKCFHVVKH